MKSTVRWVALSLALVPAACGNFTPDSIPADDNTSDDDAFQSRTTPLTLAELQAEQWRSAWNTIIANELKRRHDAATGAAGNIKD